MEVIAGLLFLIGLAIAIVYGIVFLVVAFKNNILWGLGCLFVPGVSLVFLIMYWEDAKSPFLKSLLAIPFYVVGMIIMSFAAGGPPA